MRIKARTSLTAKKDSVRVSVSVYSSAYSMKKTLEDNMKKTYAIKEFLDKDTPHKNSIEVSFGRPIRKKVIVKDITTDENGKTTETTRWEPNGYEMLSFVVVELCLGSNYKLQNIYNEAMKYTDCSVSIQYVFSKEHRRDIDSALREKLIDEAYSQIKDILPDKDVIMIDFAYHCDLPDSADRNGGVRFGKIIESDICKSIRENSDSAFEEYAELIDEIFNIDMAPYEEFSDEIFVEYAEKETIEKKEIKEKSSAKEEEENE